MEKYLPHFTEEVLKRILAATYVATFADHVAFTETVQQRKEDFSSLLQYMADCYKALFADKSSCASASVAITHPANEYKSIHALRKNINTAAMLLLTGDALLRHFRKGMYHGGIGSCALLSLMYSWCDTMRAVMPGNQLFSATNIMLVCCSMFVRCTKQVVYFTACMPVTPLCLHCREGRGGTST